MFVKYLGHAVSTLVEDVEILIGSSAKLQAVFVDCVQSLPTPPFAELKKPLRQQTVQVLNPVGIDCRFPLFVKFSKIMDTAAAKALAVYDDYEGDDVWKVLTSDVTKTVSMRVGESEPMAEVVAKHLL